MNREMGLIFVSFIFLAGQFGSSNGECGTEGDGSCDVSALTPRFNTYVNVTRIENQTCYVNGTSLGLTCQYGTITEPTSVTCTSGNWGSITDTRCTGVCPPRPVTNENVEQNPSVEGYNVTTNLAFSCKSGYKFTNDSIRGDNCKTDSTWQDGDAQPACVVFNCSVDVTDENLKLNPEVPTNKIYRGNQTVTFSCNDGFKVNGSATSECTDQNVWSNGLPTCMSSGNVAHLLWYLPVMTIPYTLLSFTM